MGTIKPDQERVKNLLAETVTLLCKNGLTYESELRIEAVIGITVDASDVFLVHINDKFGDGFPTSTAPPTHVESKVKNNITGESSESIEQTDRKSDTERTEHPQESDSADFLDDERDHSESTDVHKKDLTRQTSRSVDTPSRSGSLVVDPSIIIKIEDDEDDEDNADDSIQLGALQSPQAVAQQAFMVAGQRRVPIKRRYSGGSAGSFHQDSNVFLEGMTSFHVTKTESEEPATKRPASGDQTMYDEDDPESWRDLQNSHMYYNNAHSDPSSLPGCSSWSPTSLALSQGSSDSPMGMQWFRQGQQKRRNVRHVEQPYYCGIAGCERRYVNKRHLRRHEHLDHGLPKRRDFVPVYYSYGQAEPETGNSSQSAQSAENELVDSVDPERTSNADSEDKSDIVT